MSIPSNRAENFLSILLKCFWIALISESEHISKAEKSQELIKRAGLIKTVCDKERYETLLNKNGCKFFKNF